MTAATIEVVDAVQQLLESEGILQSIRAHLRASVLNALATNGAERKASKAVQFLSKDNGTKIDFKFKSKPHHNLKYHKSNCFLFISRFNRQAKNLFYAFWTFLLC